MSDGNAVAKAAAAEFDRVSRGGLPTYMPDIPIQESDLDDGRIWIVALITKAGFATSHNEARRLTAQGAVTLDHERIVQALAMVEVDTGYILQVGKRRFGRIVLEGGK